MSTTAIGEYALLSDRHSAALVSRDGSIDWLCFPRFDSPSIFARLLGEQAGHWSMRVRDAQRGHPSLPRIARWCWRRRYRTPTGTAVVVDALAMGEGNRGHELGRDAPHLLLRQVDVHAGRGRDRGRVRPPTRVRPRVPVARRGRRRTWPPPAGPTSWSCRARRRCRSTARPPRAGSRSPKANEPASRSTTSKRADSRHGPGLEPGRDRRAARRHRRGVAVVVGAAPGVRRSVARPRPPQRTGAPGAVVPTHRRDLRGGDHVAARGRRR